MARSTYYAWRTRLQRPTDWTRKPSTGRPRRGYVWTEAGDKVAEGQVLEWLTTYVLDPEGHAYGYRKLTTWLRREHGIRINKKTVYRILREADLVQGQPLRPAHSDPNGSWRSIARSRLPTSSLQRCTAEVLGAIYEQDFLPCSFGGRPGRGAHHALAALNEIIAGKRVSWVLEAENFFEVPVFGR